MLTRTLTISALLSVAAAQINLSASCTKALTTIATNADANACLTPSPLLPILTDSSASVVDPINNWLTSLCAAPSCSNDTIAAIVTNATTGCATDLAAIGYTAESTPAVSALIQQYYPTVRNVVCLKDGNTNCVTQTLTNIQGVLGPLSIQNVLALVAADTNVTLPANISCTNCLKAAYNAVNTEIPGLFTTDSVQNECGASFTDGATPAGISETASTKTAASQTKDSGALMLGVSSATLLMIISSAFAVFA